MKIKSPQNIELYDIQVDDRSVRYRSIMNDDSLTLHFSQPGTVTVPLGSYVDFEGQRYTLFYPENFKKHNTRNFEYTLVLHGNRELLKRYKFKDTAAIPYRLKFPLTAKPVDFITRIVQNMNLHDSGWTVGTCIDAPDKLISFNHESCFDVLGRLAQEFNTEWEIVDKTIHLQKVEKFKANPLPLSYGMGNGFKSGTGRANDGDKIPIGRLYVQGGERNIDFSTYGSLTLLLPKSSSLVHNGKTYTTDAHGMSITRTGNTNVGEDSFDGSDIYPKRVGTVSQVIAVDAAKNLYDIKDSSIPLALNYRDCRIAGEKATIVFQSGILAGREFDLEQTENDLTGYVHAERRFKIVPQEQDGMIMPGGAYIPAVGDKYAVFNIRLPEAYIRNDSGQSGASWDLFREAVKYFAENETQKFSFTGSLDGVWAKSRWLTIGGKIVPGGHVLFSDPQFLPAGEVIRIISVKDYVNSPHKPEITLSNAPVSGSFASGLAKLEADEVLIDKNRKEVIRYAQRQWRDTKETQEMLEQSMLNFSGSVNPLSIETMQLIAGDESLQFRFVNSKTNPVRINHTVSFNASTKVLNAPAGIIQHMTLGITEMSTKNRAKTYKFWDVTGYTSPPLTDAQKAFYLYLKCSKTTTSGTFVLSETAVAMEGVSGYYHFLVGILNSEQSGDRSFAPVYGYTEILPGRVTTDKIISQDGLTYFDLLNGIISGKITFTSGSSGLANLSEWAAAEQSIQDAQNSADTAQGTADSAQANAENAQSAANAAQSKADTAQNTANSALQAAQDNVSDYNAKFATIQAQVDGEISNWFYPHTPTLSNIPASDWTTVTLKDRHIGDTFTNTEQYPAGNAGKSWRFVKNATTYSWTPISDSDAVLALQRAAAAQSTADGKSTTYLVQPTAYQLGDTWVLSADATLNGIAYKSGDILTASQNSTSFNQAHWSKKVRYTDDTAANAVNAKIADILNDDIADPSDKQYLKQRWDEINGDGTNGEFFEIINKAISLGVDDNATDAFSDAHYWLGQSLSPLFVNMSINTAIDGSDLRILFKTYYLQKAAIQNAIAEKITENIEVGGDNLIKNGNFILGVQNWNYGSLNPAPTVTILTEADLPNGVVSGIKITVSQTTNGIWQNFADVGNRLELNKEYTLSFIAKHISGSNNRLFYGYEGLGHWVDLTAQWVRYKVTFKPTSYQNFSFYMGVGEFAITNIQLEKGNVVSSWKQYDYIKDALKQSTEINGGLILSSLIGVRDLNNKVRSYISGLVESNPTAFAAGVDFFGDLLNETKTIKLNHDGSGHLAGGDITWDESGNAKIGVLDIQKGTGVVRVIENNVVRYLIHPNLLETLASIRSSSSDNATINLATFSRSAWTENGNYINPNSLILIFENSSIRFTGNVSLTNNPDAAQPLPVGAPKPIDVTSVMIELYKKNSSGSFIHYTTISQDSTAPLANGGIVTNNYSVDRTIYNLPAGEYRIGYSYIIYPEGSVYISAQTFSKSKNIQTRRIEFAKDGFMAFYNGSSGENFLHMTESEGLKVGGKTDIPVGSGGGAVIGGIAANKWGKVTDIAKAGSIITITHGIGDLKYMVIVAISGSTTTWYYQNKTANSIQIVCSGNFDFALVRTPYV